MINLVKFNKLAISKFEYIIKNIYFANIFCTLILFIYREIYTTCAITHYLITYSI